MIEGIIPYTSPEYEFRDKLGQLIDNWRHANSWETADAVIKFAGPDGLGFLKIPPPPRCKEDEGATGVRCELRGPHEIHVGHCFIWNKVTEEDDLVAELRWPVEAEVMDQHDN